MKLRIYISPNINRTRAEEFFSRLESMIVNGDFEITNNPNTSHIALMVNEKDQITVDPSPVRINIWLFDLPFSSPKENESWIREYQKDILEKILFAKDLLSRITQLELGKR